MSTLIIICVARLQGASELDVVNIDKDLENLNSLALHNENLDTAVLSKMAKSRLALNLQK